MGKNQVFPYGFLRVLYGRLWGFYGFRMGDQKPGFCRFTVFLRVLDDVLRCSYGVPTGFYGVPTAFVRVPAFSPLKICQFLRKVSSAMVFGIYPNSSNIPNPFIAKAMQVEWFIRFFPF